MGTSKGYIAPSTPYWSNAKRSVSGYIGDPSDNHRTQAVKSYAKAALADNLPGTRVIHTFSGFLNFVEQQRVDGNISALSSVGREDISLMSSEDALTELMYYFANGNQTIDDAIAIDCLSATFDKFNIINIEDISNIQQNELLKELVLQFVMRKFAQMFDKQIRNKCESAEQADTRIQDVQQYLYYTLVTKLTEDRLQSINPQNLANEQIVQNACKEAYELLERYYGDET